jgi:hypothetical protein
MIVDVGSWTGHIVESGYSKRDETKAYEMLLDCIVLRSAKETAIIWDLTVVLIASVPSTFRITENIH